MIETMGRTTGMGLTGVHDSKSPGFGYVGAHLVHCLWSEYNRACVSGRLGFEQWRPVFCMGCEMRNALR